MLVTTLGHIAVNNANRLSRATVVFKSVWLLQKLMVYASQLGCYGRCHEILEKFLSVDVSATQVSRPMDFYGAELEGKELELLFLILRESDGKVVSPVSESTPAY